MQLTSEGEAIPTRVRERGLDWRSVIVGSVAWAALTGLGWAAIPPRPRVAYGFAVLWYWMIATSVVSALCIIAGGRRVRSAALGAFVGPALLFVIAALYVWSFRSYGD